MSENLIQLEYRPGDEVVIRIKSPKLHMLSDPAQGHLTNARREIMMALRDMLDSALEKSGKSKGEVKTRKRKIVVE